MAKLGSVGEAMPGFGDNNPSDKSKRSGKDLPVGVTAMREYVGCMSFELAQMARGNGDEKLAVLLETAACIAREEIRLEA